MEQRLAETDLALGIHYPISRSNQRRIYLSHSKCIIYPPQRRRKRVREPGEAAAGCGVGLKHYEGET